MSDERGFTLTEVAVACALLGILLIPMLRFFDSAVSGAAELQSSTQQHADARSAIDQLTRELRQAYLGHPTLPPLTVEPQKLTFYSPDTATPFHLRRITYQLKANQLQRSVTVSTDDDGYPWVFGPAGPFFPVMDARVEDAFSQSATDPRRVDINLVGLNSKGRADRPFTTSVELRNV
jgi:prepilin-type N-terminal cleavage/methylation domain-containing protein